MKKEVPGSRMIPIILSMLFMALGAWAVFMAIKGETPAQPLDKPGDRLIMGIFGAMFCAAGVMGVVNVLLAGHARGPAIVAGIAVTTGILFGLCFLAVAILQPDEIVSTSSVNGIVVSRSKGGWSGRLIFSIAGVLPIIFAKQIYRGYKKTVEKNNFRNYQNIVKRG